MSATFWRGGLFAIAAGLVSVMLVYALVLGFARGEWLAVEGRVHSTSVVSSRSGGGPLAWELVAQFEYEASGDMHVSFPMRVFLDEDRAIVVAEQTQWPPGRIHAIYYDAHTPTRASLYFDGGAQASAVVATFLFVLFAGLGVLCWVLIRRRRK